MKKVKIECKTCKHYKFIKNEWALKTKDEEKYICTNSIYDLEILDEHLENGTPYWCPILPKNYEKHIKEKLEYEKENDRIKKIRILNKVREGYFEASKEKIERVISINQDRIVEKYNDESLAYKLGKDLHDIKHKTID